MSNGWIEMHKPCPHCGSSDGASLGTSGIWKCFACEKAWPSDELAESGKVLESTTKARKGLPLLKPSSSPVVKRGITPDTARKFGYVYDEDRQWHIATYRSDGRPLAQHLRGPNKQFAWRGDASELDLWGLHLWKDGGKRIVITEGEFDAMSVSQAQNNNWPTVSISGGVGSAVKDIKRNLQRLLKFDEIVLMFDTDEPGQEAAKRAAALLPIGKGKIASLNGYKDANEALMAGDIAEIKRAIWDAAAYRPDGVVMVGDILEKAITPPEVGLPWWDSRLTDITYGRRYGELYALGAGTGVGKTDWIGQQIAYDVTELGLKVGILALEQQPEETAVRIAGKIDSRLYHLPDCAAGHTAELKATLNSISDNVMLYDSWGVAEIDTVEATIRYMCAWGAKVIYLDHLTALADPENERTSLEGITKRLAGLTNELKIVLMFVSHLATPESGSHEEGARVLIRQFKGSRSIGFWSFFMFGLERNQADVGGPTTFRVLKDRHTGRATGVTMGLRYDGETGRLLPVELSPNAATEDFGDYT